MRVKEAESSQEQGGSAVCAAKTIFLSDLDLWGAEPLERVSGGVRVLCVRLLCLG